MSSMPRGTSKLYASIVLAGVAIGGCSSNQESDSGAGMPGDASTAGDADAAGLMVDARADASPIPNDGAARDSTVSKDGEVLADAGGASDAAHPLDAMLDAMLEDCGPGEYRLPDGSCEIALIL
jgi:hypothetical protein